METDTPRPDETIPLEPPPRKSFGWRFAEAYARWADRWGPRLFIILVLVMGVAIVYFDRTFIFIRSGEQGVLWHRFTGTDLEHRYTEGMTIIFPWDDMHIYDVRAQEVSDRFTVLSRDGLSITIEVSIRFRPQIDRLPLLHVDIGPNYVDKLVKPEVRAKIRYLIGQYLPEEIYSSQGLLVRKTVEDAAPELAEGHVTLEDLLIKSITLPPRVQDSIELKMQQQQAYLEYEFRLKREEKEKERKKIEAEGIQHFQQTIEANGSTFEKYLTYLGIQATLALAQSNNAKVVVIGGNEKGLPLILNTADNDGGGSPRAGDLRRRDRTPPAGGATSAGASNAQTAVSPIAPTPTMSQPLPEVLSQAVENTAPTTRPAGR